MTKPNLASLLIIVALGMASEVYAATTNCDCLAGARRTVKVTTYDDTGRVIQTDYVPQRCVASNACDTVSGSLYYDTEWQCYSSGAVAEPGTWLLEPVVLPQIEPQPGSSYGTIKILPK